MSKDKWDSADREDMIDRCASKTQEIERILGSPKTRKAADRAEIDIILSAIDLRYYRRWQEIRKQK